MNEGAWRFTILGYQAGFAQPWFLALLLLGALVGALAVREALSRRGRAQAVIAQRLLGSLAPGISTLRPAIRSGLTAFSLALLAVALSQPQCGSKSELVKRRGIDVVVALDASKSMLAHDVAPSRIDRAKLELMTLLDELKGDRVAVVVFAGEAFIQCPLTSDYEAAKLFLRAVDPMQMPQGGTDIGGALQMARQVFDGADRGSKEKVVVLLSDGEDVSGEVKEGVDALKEEGIRVYAVGIGSEAGEPIPVTGRNGEFLGYQKDRNGETVLTRLDRAGLMSLAEDTGGELFYQPRGVAMGEVISRIDKLQKDELESRVAVRYDERFQWLALPALALLLAASLLPRSRRIKGAVPAAAAMVQRPAAAEPSPAPAARGGGA